MAFPVTLSGEGFRKCTALLVAGCMLVSGCAGPRRLGGNGSGRPDIRSFSSEEISAGQEIHSRILSSFYVYTEPKAVNYVNQIVRDLTGKRGSSNNRYQVTILYNERIYATSAPGGFIYVTTGLINFLDNEAELAGVLAHEVASLQFKDYQMKGYQDALGSLTQGVALASPAFGNIGALVMLGLVVAGMMTEAQQLTKDDKVMAADGLALQYMVHAGYDPQGLVDVLYKFLNAGKQVTPYFFDYYQSHPITEERFDHLNESFSKLPLTGKRFDVHRNRFLDMTKGIQEIYKPA